jgi:hypothetical protein
MTKQQKETVYTDAKLGMMSIEEMKHRAINNNVCQIKIEIVPTFADGIDLDKKILDEFLSAIDESAKTILKLEAIDIFARISKV